MSDLDLFRDFAAKLGVEAREEVQTTAVLHDTPQSEGSPAGESDETSNEERAPDAEAWNLIDLYDDPCPGFPYGVWDRIRSIMGRFLREHAAQARALGWTDAELYGVDPAVGAARLDRCGALIVATAPVVSVTADAITYANKLVYRRVPVAGPVVPVWEYRWNAAGIEYGQLGDAEWEENNSGQDPI